VESMVGIDAKFLYSETATAHMHTIKVAISDVSGMPGGFTYDGLVDVLGEHIGRLPTFRRRVVAVPLGLGHPVWVEDPDFDLARHLFRRLLPLPGGPRQLGAVIAEIASRPLRRDRPLWEMVVVEGLAGGRIAIVAKLHHALADGSAAVALLKNIVEAVGEPPGAPPEDGWHPEALPTRGQLLRIAGRDHVARLRGLPRLAVQSIRGIRDSEVLRRHLAVPDEGSFLD
jgi:diacylglycerol O-acyltransferase